ncbi:MAG TPA: M20/M25/M40 family metallo-hydrolase, partial [Wenzhouxiangella sp.]|nr:M20/M25/M40 family metallo-hydrolase [Wenzhouxiangella sp.]
TRFNAEAADTVIPDVATLGGSFRLGRPELREQINGLIEGIAASTAAAYGVEAHVNIERRYDATVNHAAQADEYRHALKAELGEGWQDEALALPIMASEDFSYYLQEIPGAFALVGADDGKGHHHPCHSAHYDFNDRLIDSVGRIYARLAGVPVES